MIAACIDLPELFFYHPLMQTRILYAGDTTLATAASYLAGVMKHHGFAFDYVPSDQPLPMNLPSGGHGLYIFSDYPAANIATPCAEAIVDNIRQGAGLLMLGGWASYHGLDGNYNASPLAKALPVTISGTDDRINCPQPCLVEKLCDHPILADLPFNKPPGIGGYNSFVANANSQALLGARHFGVSFDGGGFKFSKGGLAPLLVVGEYGGGRTAALATDAAPHWVGGLVDWGEARVEARADGADAIEVGDFYARFFAQLIGWTMGRD